MAALVKMWTVIWSGTEILKIPDAEVRSNTHTHTFCNRFGRPWDSSFIHWERLLRWGWSELVWVQHWRRRLKVLQSRVIETDRLKAWLALNSTAEWTCPWLKQGLEADLTLNQRTGLFCFINTPWKGGWWYRTPGDVSTLTQTATPY